MMSLKARRELLGAVAPQEQIPFTRSRLYKKKDQAHVEQKNWTHVRQFVGYGRFAGLPPTKLYASTTNECQPFIVRGQLCWPS